MSEETAIAGKRAPVGMSPATAQRLEWSLIGLGIVALALIFQPFSLALFGVGCALVVFAGLANNLLPLCQPGTTLRSIVVASVIVALTFFVIMLISIAAAYLYGVFFVNAFAPDTSEPFYRQPFVWARRGNRRSARRASHVALKTLRSTGRCSNRGRNVRAVRVQHALVVDADRRGALPPVRRHQAGGL